MSESLIRHVGLVPRGRFWMKKQQKTVLMLSLLSESTVWTCTCLRRQI